MTKDINSAGTAPERCQICAGTATKTNFNVMTPTIMLRKRMRIGLRRIIPIEGRRKKSMTLTGDIERMHDRTTDLTVLQTFADGRTNILKIGRVTDPQQTRNTRTL